MSHDELVDRACRWLRTTMRCKVVLAERVLRAGGEQPDAIGWTARGGSLVVECKCSRADFYADRQKPHRRHPELAMGRFRYYMTEPGLLRGEELPPGFGLIEVPSVDARTRMIVKSTRAPFSEDRERDLLVSELSRYQLHGLMYPTLSGQPQSPVYMANVEAATGDRTYG